MAGRPTDYDKDVVPSVRDHIEKRRLDGRVPSIKGLAVFLDVNRSTLYEWAKHHPEFSDILDSLQSNQAEMLIDHGLDGIYSLPFAKMMLTKHGYRDVAAKQLSSPTTCLSKA
jgi:hypothetical protein